MNNNDPAKRREWRKLEIRVIKANRWLASKFRVYPYIKFYCFTISPHTKYAEALVVTSAVQDIFIKYKHVVTLMYVAEISNLDKYHVHGVLGCMAHCKFARLRKHPTCNYHFKKLDDGDEWFEYIMKNGPSEMVSMYKNAIQPYGYSTDVNIIYAKFRK